MNEEKKEIKYILHFPLFFKKKEIFSLLIIYILTYKKRSLYRQLVYRLIRPGSPLCMAVAGRDKRLFSSAGTFFFLHSNGVWKHSAIVADFSRLFFFLKKKRKKEIPINQYRHLETLFHFTCDIRLSNVSHKKRKWRRKPAGVISEENSKLISPFLLFVILLRHANGPWKNKKFSPWTKPQRKF